MSGFEQPNYTQAPNKFFDELLPQIDSMSELKVTLVVIRQTLGYHKDEDELSISRLVELTGLSRPSVVDGVRRGLQRGTITRREVNPGGKQDRYAYRARVVKNLNQSPHEGSKESLPEVVKNLNPQKKEKETITPTGKPASPSSADPSRKKWEDCSTGEKQAYLVSYLHQRLDERDLETPSPGYKQRLSGELKTFINRGRPKSDLLFALDHVVARWSEKRLEFWQAMGDVDSGRGPGGRHLRVVEEPPRPQKRVIS